MPLFSPEETWYDSNNQEVLSDVPQKEFWLRADPEGCEIRLINAALGYLR